MEEHEKICRLCLKNCGIYFKCIEKNASEMLGFLLKNNLFINKEAVMCANCEESIKYCSEFRRICLDVEGSILPLKNGHNICRLCMGILNVCSSLYLDSKLEDDTPTIIMLDTCLPELDWSVTEKPIICVPCHKSLHHYFSFITNFLIVEERIKQYCEAAGMDATCLIRLKNVLEFTTKNTLGMVDRIKVEGEFSGDELVDNQEYRNELYPSENMSANTDADEVNGINVGKTFEEVDCKIEFEPHGLIKIEDKQLNDVPRFTTKCEEDEGQVNVMEMKRLFQRGMSGGNKCSYYECPNSARKTPNIRKFKFPVKDDRRCQLWILHSGNSELSSLPKEKLATKFICQDHFEARDKSGKRLSISAVPINYKIEYHSIEDHKSLRTYSQKKISS